jgi:hypothetical protein
VILYFDGHWLSTFPVYHADTTRKPPSKMYPRVLCKVQNMPIESQKYLETVSQQPFLTENNLLPAASLKNLLSWFGSRSPYWRSRRGKERCVHGRRRGAESANLLGENWWEGNRMEWRRLGCGGSQTNHTCTQNVCSHWHKRGRTAIPFVKV